MIGMKFRYSVRACLVVTCVVASLCYWRVRPGMVANRFVNSLAAKDYTRANRMLDERMSLDLVYWATNGKDMSARATFDEPTFSDWVLGQRRGQLFASVTFDRTVIGRSAILMATATGVTYTQQDEATGKIASEADNLGDLLDAGLEEASAWLDRLRR